MPVRTISPDLNFAEHQFLSAPIDGEMSKKKFPFLKLKAWEFSDDEWMHELSIH